MSLRRFRAVSIPAIALVVLSACSTASETATIPPPSAPAATATTAAPGSTGTAGSTATDPTAVVSTTSTDAPIPVTTPEPSNGVDLPRVVIEGPSVNETSLTPVFSWTPVEGADRYRLTVLDADAHPVWSWMGTETMARIGDRPIDGTDPGGPTAPAGGSWRVTALDGSGHAIATSESRAFGS